MLLASFALVPSNYEDAFKQASLAKSYIVKLLEFTTSSEDDLRIEAFSAEDACWVSNLHSARYLYAHLY